MAADPGADQRVDGVLELLQAGHRVYDAEQGYDYDNIYVMQNADLELIVERVKDFFTETLPGAIGGILRKLPFVG